MAKALNLDVYYDIATDTYRLVNPETEISVTLPKKFTPEIHKVIRGK